MKNITDKDDNLILIFITIIFIITFISVIIGIFISL